uniref:AMMECR1 domain-containing protein n=1 Tax=Pyrodinium bahamense TaxID=73915 RepID=A0A7S0BCN9_9DINO|mmetsp:Transcript_9728/g.27214  ORF Transcript_9728/g.27214 Transcript_9728/m.27214 type:complete len:213 (+) Transcript_9728:77-715(+)
MFRSSEAVLEVTEELVAFCFKVLLAQLQQRPEPSLCVAEAIAAAKVAGLFVTWKTPDDHLRGCMGALHPVPLDRGLADFALRSALHDRRFEPVELQEVPSLTCRVSLLHSFEPCMDAHDWEVGVHGVHIAFEVPSGPFCPCDITSYEATFLPEVMVEHDMDHEVAIRKLVRKAGYRGNCDESLVDGIDATRFQSSIREFAFSDLARRHGLAA